MRALQDIFQKNSINYGWIMVVVVFKLIWGGFLSIASNFVFLKKYFIVFYLCIGKKTF